MKNLVTLLLSIVLISNLFLSSIVVPVSAQTSSTLTINVQSIVRDVYPEIFGITNAPDASSTDAWNKIDNVGVTMIRKDYSIEKSVPNSTIADYKANVNNVKDISTWNQGALNGPNGLFTNAKQKNMKVMGIVDYAPAWLTYSGTVKGIPKDWEVWEDIVKKVHSVYKDKVDVVEIWNEPNYSNFFEITGSPYSSVAEAYIDLYKHTHKAIREVDPNVIIGGPSSFQYYQEDFIRAVLADSYLRDNLDYVSFHSYPSNKSFEVPNTQATKRVLAEYGLNNMPISVSEWNYHPGQPNDRHTEPQGISFIGRTFLDFWRTGVISSHYYVGRPYTVRGEKSFYKWSNNVAELLPPTRAFQVASEALGLGKGKGKLVQSSATGSTDGVGLINSSQKPAAFVTNDTTLPNTTQVTFNGLTPNMQYLVKYFEGSETNTGQTPYKTENLSAVNGQIQIEVVLPPTSVQGILLEPQTIVVPTATIVPDARVCKADINEDRIVDLKDYSLLIRNYLKTPISNIRADINDDGKVDLVDYSLLVRSFLQTCAIATTSTPILSPTNIPSVATLFEQNGQLVFEAEDYTSKTAGVGNNDEWSQITSIPNSSGGKAMRSLPDDQTNTFQNYRNGSAMNYVIKFSTPGRYYLSVRGEAVVGDGTDDSVFVGFDGAAFAPSDNGGMHGFALNEYKWRELVGTQPVYIDVTQTGDVTFTVWSREDGIVLDRFALSTSEDFILHGSTTDLTEVPSSGINENNGLVIMEAEDFTIKTNGVDNNDVWTEVSTLSNSSGNKAMRPLPDDQTISNKEYQKGAMISYDINFQTPGRYYLSVRGAAVVGDGSDDSVFVGFNGSPFLVSNTDGMPGFTLNEYKWRELVGTQPVYLDVNQAGKQTVNLWVREDGIAIDKLVLSTSPDLILHGSTAVGP